MDADPLAELIGDSPAMAAVRHTLGRLLAGQSRARRPVSVLLLGETGVGKSLVAQVLHRAGPRDGAFVDVNCAGIPSTLLEAELFGFEQGAFTDARRAKPGLLEEADGGTLFLDEVGLLPAESQAKLLKVLEEGMVRRLGATRGQPVDVWIIAATSEDLESAARERRFRSDLYHRLAVVTVHLPALRQRPEDIIPLGERFLREACAGTGLPPRTLTAEARAALRAYSWPGNIRELKNVITRAVLLTDASELPRAALQLPAGSVSASGRAAAGDRPTRLQGQSSGGGGPDRGPGGPDRAGPARHGVERLPGRGPPRVEPQPASISHRQARPGPRAAGRTGGARDRPRRTAGEPVGHDASTRHEPDRPGARAPRHRAAARPPTVW